MADTFRRIAFIVITLTFFAGVLLPVTGCGVAEDSKLQAKIKDELRKDLNVQHEKLTVNVKAGVVSISGELYTPEEIDRVIEIATAIEGVIEVRDMMNLPDTFQSTNPTFLFY